MCQVFMDTWSLRLLIYCLWVQNLNVNNGLQDNLPSIHVMFGNSICSVVSMDSLSIYLIPNESQRLGLGKV